MHHYYQVIVHAQKEVLFATCWWLKGEISNMMIKALRDLSKRANEEKRTVIVKLMFDQLTKENITHSHGIVPPNKWSLWNIPPPDELPFISMEINCYHRMIMGTFHPKFLVVDRKVALLNSNNIYDRPNLEMMVHYEGDIVNSFYDTFLISWSIPFQPNLVCLKEEAPAYQDFHFGADNPTIVSIKESLQKAVARARLRLQHYHNTDETKTYFDEEEYSTPPEQRKQIHRDLSDVVLEAVRENQNTHSPDILFKGTTELVGNVINCDASPQTKSPLTNRLNESCKSAQSAESASNLSSEQLEKLTFNFTPFIFHTPHEPFPIAFVNRLPNGIPGHIDKFNPQDIAWLYAFRYAQKSIFIQSPTFNASPAIDGVIAACRRGIKVTLWIDLGYNYWKESLGTLQGGTNEHVMKKIYKELKHSGDGAEKNLQTFWYTAKGKSHSVQSSFH